VNKFLQEFCFIVQKTLTALNIKGVKVSSTSYSNEVGISKEGVNSKPKFPINGQSCLIYKQEINRKFLVGLKVYDKNRERCLENNEMGCENLPNQIIRIELTIHQNAYFDIMDKNFLSFCSYSELHIFYSQLVKNLVPRKSYLEKKNFIEY